MFFRQILHEDLGCASYLVADERTGLVIDPQWDADVYLDLASQHGFTITDVLETHTHADHVSGHARLCEASGATLHVPEGSGVTFDHSPLRHGNELEFGNTRIEILATPGHRLEHVSLLLTDSTRSGSTLGLIAGDSLFVGDVARPDLAIDPEKGSRLLFQSLRAFDRLQDDVQLWPGHVGGSLCGGREMSEKPSSTLGVEQRHNPFLRIQDEDLFVGALLADLPSQPPNFERILELNAGALLTGVREVEALDPSQARDHLALGALLLDGRDIRAFDTVHVPGSLSVTLGSLGFGTRAGWVVDAQKEVIVTAESRTDVRRMVRMLQAVGIFPVGYLAGGVAGWEAAGFEVEAIASIDVAALADGLRRDAVLLLDVREEDEWALGHVPGSIRIAYHDLPEQLPTAEIDDRPIAVACATGIRSGLATSLLKRLELGNDLLHVADGGVSDLDEHGVSLASSNAL